ncbi:MAG TPA: DUF309 domain-containing protein [Actinomycetota bacterium]|nr:DUF309 domain-containing protein [Actinomycetota bacterium]
MTDSLGELPPHLVEGIRLFASGQYFLAHETLEEYWVDAPAEERSFYQGLIQLATAFHHLVRGNLVGAQLQFGKALARLSAYPDAYQGVDVAGIRAFLQAVPERLARGEALTPPRLGTAA